MGAPHKKFGEKGPLCHPGKSQGKKNGKKLPKRVNPPGKLKPKNGSPKGNIPPGGFKPPGFSRGNPKI